MLSDGLLIDGARMAKPDPAVVGARRPPAPPSHRPADASTPAPTPNRGARCCCCSRAARKRCAPTAASARLWATAGGPSLEISEIDYAEVLREKQGLAATIDSIIEAAMSGPTLTVDDAAMRAVVDIIKDPGKLEQLMQTLETDGGEEPAGRRAPDRGAPQHRPRPRGLRRPHRPAAAEHGLRTVRPRRAGTCRSRR